MVPINVVPYSKDWPAQFADVARELSRVLADVSLVSIEHVGSTAVPGLAAKPILDIDIIVKRQYLPAAISALTQGGYVHQNDLGVVDREEMDTIFTLNTRR